MKNILLYGFFMLVLSSSSYAQSPFVQDAWVPVRVDSVKYVPNIVPITNYHMVYTPVYSTTIQYFRTPVLYTPVYFQPCVYLQPPAVYYPGPVYYVNPPRPYRCFKY